MTQTLLITGTNTDAGKTVLTTALAAYWQTYYPQKRLGIFKPMQTGTGDWEHYHQQFNLDQTPQEIAPLQFSHPVAPPVAAEREGRSIELKGVWQALNRLQQQRDIVLVEGLGGLGSPVTHELTVADIARDWKLPSVIVVPVALGAIAQSVATVALARQSGVQIKGIVLNCVQPRSAEEIADWTPIELIQSLTQVPILGILPHVADPTDLSKLAQVASELDIERLF
ncbi:MAG: dethiobiotin synthase [Coleofasciculus sp. B1-GNL1-01]|uniref:dethiobiotin synthase n=1 Tax=Coleofasciculus sp. B1-GNL1-01 TaxID=3068484 RepID=UPI003304BF29